MTAIVAVNFDWSIESCDIAPRDLNYERNTEKYGRAMKLTIGSENKTEACLTIQLHLIREISLMKQTMNYLIYANHEMKEFLQLKMPKVLQINAKKW